MNSLSLKSPAKLNLSLRVLRKREDGFHEIETLMVKLPGLADQLDFQEAADFSFQCDDPSLASDESNLVVKATRAFQIATGQPCRYSLNLRKFIPHGAGLGGGSSDAATTLHGLNQLHGYPLAVDAMMKLGEELGSDVPFFLRSGAALCTGRGEKIEQVPSPPVLRVMLFKPTFSVATPDAYGRWENSTELTGITYSPQEQAGLLLFNDLERPVFQKHRFLAELKQWLLTRRETTAALMSGSGSAVFAILAPDASPAALAQAALYELDPHLWTWSGETEA